MAAPASIDDYIRAFPEDVQVVLRAIRTTIKDAAPEASEAISYQIPTFKVGGKYLVYFAGYKNHVSVYPIPAVDEELERAIEPYQTGKGTLRFPLSKPVPYELIRRVTEAHRKRLH
jgi:uncharacterized protein YdhG (YjbR/CyaY superfamily)